MVLWQNMDRGDRIVRHLECYQDQPTVQHVQICVNAAPTRTMNPV